jgi:hypothetical protein
LIQQYYLAMAHFFMRTFAVKAGPVAGIVKVVPGFVREPIVEDQLVGAK